ncbi:MAG TPA: MG2 domain-containing protein [Thermoplasmata archaeon]|nr:MG2 domain-containing protein [Thermoplasmata archaeon]
MTDRTGRCVKALGLLVFLIVGVAAPIATLVAVSTPALAGPCDQVGGVVTGDWTISNVQVCSGILYTVDGSITINAGGSLTLIDGGLMFAKDQAHAGYSLTVNAGGELVLDNSTVTTQTQAIAPYLKLALTVSGANSRLTMRNGAVLRFPGWFNATGATIDMTDSTVTGFTSPDLSRLGVYEDDNDDGPVPTWSATIASLYRSRIERIYENASATAGNATGILVGNLSLRAGSNLYAYDSYIGADYSNVVGLHNELQVDGSSNAYLYGVTIDRTQDPVSMSEWQPAFVPLAAGGNVYLLRWLHLTAVDSTGFPVSGAAVWSTLSPSAATAQYPDNGFFPTPSARTLSYLGRTATGPTAWNVTDAGGVAVIPLATDQVTTASLPNAESYGNYREAVTYTTFATSGGVNFDPYPAVDATANNVFLTTPFATLQVRTGPDLMLSPTDYGTTLTVIQNQPFTVYALIYNQGQTTATGVSVAAYLNGGGSALDRRDGLTVATFLNQSLTIPGIGTLGAQTLMLVVDPDNAIIEGGSAQESNNFVNITLNVQTPPNGFVAILTPSPGQAVQPGSALSVTGYVRDESSVGIVGVPLTIELRSGGSTVATNLTTSQSPDGFFLGTINVPGNAPEGSYTIVVGPTTGPIQPDTLDIAVRKSTSFLDQPVPLLGLPVWFLLLIILIVISIAVAVTVYFRVYGLGKMVECGECGSFIAQDSTSCPKCGVEFEKDMAKCSNCQAWIPADIRQCPECGVEFATGKVEMADYQEKMRMQYDEVVLKFKREASSQLGRALSDAEFQDWWRRQPSFVTFEDWLREEEEMRKMGSKACPVCNTLNSVTATVCHKCGTYLKGERKPWGGASARRPAAAEQPAEGVAPPTEAVPAKVMRKPAPPIPEITKKGPKGESSEDGSTGTDDI